MLKNVNRKEVVFIITLLIVIAILTILPTGFQKQEYKFTEGVRAKVISVNNNGIHSTGIFKLGDQSALIEIETGSRKGEQIRANNMLTGSLSVDKIFREGDKAWVLIGFDEENNINFANMIDHYRIDKEMILIGVFAVVIIIFSGYTGVRTLLSFAFALLSIWKILIPAMLRGYNPLIVALFVGNVLTVSTLLLVAGFSKKAYAAIISAVTCSLVTCVLAIIFGNLFNIHGAVMEGAESLLYAGFMNLDLTSIFQAGIYLASSGAILDLAIDISSALEEIINNSPDISKSELIKSGLNIGKSVVGSQTTTLLFAYMGSYITIMMVYVAQGTPMMNILNSKTIAAEILHTFVGCLGLVLVSPMTSVISGFIFEKGRYQI
ncbi:YibE/F family protein [Sedimentibacter sp.]|uniref:YibE/F family protein n=1 Tax=Sedimentibacter sp. TaxID=1960295 RepID=UPI0028A582EE|nr:YibE/F family protein [Sedimentibacter sp.]